MRSVGRLLPRRTVAVRGTGMGIRRLEGIRVLGAFTAVLLISELLSALTTAISGAMLDAVLIPAALAQFTRAEAAPYRRLLPVLALVALIRTLSIAAVVPRLPQITWYALVGIPLLLGAALTIRLIDEPLEQLHLRIDQPALDASLAGLGVPLGLVGFFLLRPQPPISHPGLLGLIAEEVILLVTAAFVEELIFRGLLQAVVIETYGRQRLGVAYSAGVSAILYLGSGSIPYTIGVAGLGLLLGAVLLRGASLWGVTACHGIALVGMATLWPALFG